MITTAILSTEACPAIIFYKNTKTLFTKNKNMGHVCIGEWFHCVRCRKIASWCAHIWLLPCKNWIPSTAISFLLKQQRPWFEHIVACTLDGIQSPSSNQQALVIADAAHWTYFWSSTLYAVLSGHPSFPSLKANRTQKRRKSKVLGNITMAQEQMNAVSFKPRRTYGNKAPFPWSKVYSILQCTILLLVQAIKLRFSSLFSVLCLHAS